MRQRESPLFVWSIVTIVAAATYRLLTTLIMFELLTLLLSSLLHTNMYVCDTVFN